MKVLILFVALLSIAKAATIFIKSTDDLIDPLIDGEWSREVSAKIEGEEDVESIIEELSKGEKKHFPHFSPWAYFNTHHHQAIKNEDEPFRGPEQNNGDSSDHDHKHKDDQKDSLEQDHEYNHKNEHKHHHRHPNDKYKYDHSLEDSNHDLSKNNGHLAADSKESIIFRNDDDEEENDHDHDHHDDHDHDHHDDHDHDHEGDHEHDRDLERKHDPSHHQNHQSENHHYHDEDRSYGDDLERDHDQDEQNHENDQN